MKNKKLYIAMLVLIIGLLGFLYVMKAIFPEQFVLFVENENIVKAGNYIDTHKWLYTAIGCVTAFITYWLALCACKRKFYLNWKEILVVIAFIAAVRIIRPYDSNIANHLNIISFFVIPLIFKHDLRIATIVYSVHGIAQCLSLTIRNLPMYLTSVNSLTMLLMIGECYVWLFLFYILFNFKSNKIIIMK